MAGPIEQKSAKVKLFGARNSPPAYSIRDFLQRSVVAFEWIELQNDEEARSLAHVDNQEFLKDDQQEFHFSDEKKEKMAVGKEQQAREVKVPRSKRRGD